MMHIRAAAPDLAAHSAVLAATEPAGTAALLMILGTLIAVSVLLSRVADRFGVPVVLLFLVIGMVGGSDGLGGIEFSDYGLAARFGTAALVLILFDGGLNTSFAAVRQAALPASILATVGVAGTAGLVALFARLLGLSWGEALLLGAVVSSTDAAAVFAVLRGGRTQLRRRFSRTLEVESCINDPMAVILTTVLIDAYASGQWPGWELAYAVPVQFAIGGGIAAAFGYGGRKLLSWVRLSTTGLYTPLTLAIAFMSFGSATLAGGSGFLAVYGTALVLSNGPLPYRNGLMRVHDALAWLSQIAMFLMLGLLIYPSNLPRVAAVGVGVGLFLSFIARPVIVGLCLAPLRYPVSEVLGLGWVGLRGAVPIILATYPALAGIEGTERVFNLVFFVVLVSSVVPGSTIRHATRWLGITAPEKPTPAAVLEVNATHTLRGELTSFHIDPSLIVCGATLAEIDVPAGSSVVLIVRGRELVAARGDTRLESGDHVYLFFRPEDRPLVELLFGGPERG